MEWAQAQVQVGTHCCGHERVARRRQATQCASAKARLIGLEGVIALSSWMARCGSHTQIRGPGSECARTHGSVAGH